MTKAPIPDIQFWALRKPERKQPVPKEVQDCNAILYARSQGRKKSCHNAFKSEKALSFTLACVAELGKDNSKVTSVDEVVHTTAPVHGQKVSIKTYFGRPYHSGDRGSNENCNGFIRRTIKKGRDISTISREQTTELNRAINSKRRKMFQYRRSRDRFLYLYQW